MESQPVHTNQTVSLGVLTEVLLLEYKGWHIKHTVCFIVVIYKK